MLVALLFLVATSEAVICPEGITFFAAHDDNQYYSCPKVGLPAKLNSCQPGMIFDRASETCVGVEKRSVAGDIINRPIIGEDVRLGTLYDARRGFLYNGFEIYTRENLANRTYTVSENGSTSKVYTEHNSHSRMENFGLGASLELEFLGGVVSAKGSAKVLSDEKKSSNYARVVLKSEVVTGYESIEIQPYDVDFDYCDMVHEKYGPTHVVTNIVYGQRANFIFQKKASSLDQFEEIEGDLSAKVGITGLLTVSGNVFLHANGSVIKNDKEIRVKFYGDTFLDSVPTTWPQAVNTYNNALKEHTKSVPIKFSLTSIQNYCSDRNIFPIVKEITTSLTNGVIRVLRDLEVDCSRVAGLLETDAAIRYPAMKAQLAMFETALEKYRVAYAARVSNILPLIKAASADESELIALVNDYMESAFEHTRVKSFLDQREREIIAITKIAANALTRNDLILADPTTATDNACILERQYATVFKLNILPGSENTKNFLANMRRDWNEADSWINDGFELYRIGQQKQAFEKYVDTNLADQQSGPKCYLVRLDLLKNDKKYEMHLYRSGRQITNSFQPPIEAPRKLKSTLNATESLEFTLDKSLNPDVFGIRMIATEVAGPSIITEHPNSDRVTVTGLKPGTVYEVTAEYIVQNDHGVSPKTSPVHCTTRSISRPPALTVTETKADAITIVWAKPENIAPVLTDIPISYTVSITGPDTKALTTSALELEITGLTAGSLYTVSVVATLQDTRLSDPDSLPTEMPVITAPSAPPPPTVSGIDNNRATLRMDMSQVSVPDGVSKDYLSMMYYQVDERGEMVANSGASFVQRVWIGSTTEVHLGNLVKATTYQVKLKVLVRMGKSIVASPYSDAIDITTTDHETSYEKLKNELVGLNANSDETCDSIGTELERFSTRRQTLVDRLSPSGAVMALRNTSETWFRSFSLSSNIAQKRKCRLEGMNMFESNHPNYIATNCQSFEDCVYKCSWRDGCNAVSYNSKTRTCASVRRRSGLMIFPVLYTHSTSLYCSSGSSFDGWEQCVKRDVKLGSGRTLATASGVASLDECVSLCQMTDDCTAVTYTSNSCSLIQYLSAGHTVSSPGTDSVNLKCLAANKPVERCTKGSRRFNSTYKIGSSRVPNLRKCVEFCGNGVRGCEGVSFNDSTLFCEVFSTRDEGNTLRDDNYSSVSLACLGVREI